MKPARLLLFAMLAVCACAKAAEDVPLMFHADTGTFFDPGYHVDIEGGTLVYKIVFDSEEEKRLITLKSVKITPTQEQWKQFRQALDQINVWHWQQRYEIIMPDGGWWSLEVKYPDKQVKSSGANAYPGFNGELQEKQNGEPTKSYRQLIMAIEKLIGGRKFDGAAANDDARLYAVLMWPLPRVVFREASCADALEFLRFKATENISRNPKNKDLKVKFIYRYSTDKPRKPVVYDRQSISYVTALTDVLDQEDLDYEMLAPDTILIKDRSATTEEKRDAVVPAASKELRELITSLPPRESVVADVALFRDGTSKTDPRRPDAEKRLVKAKAGFARLRALLHPGTPVFDYPGLLALARPRYNDTANTYSMLLGISPGWNWDMPQGVNPDEFEVIIDSHGIITGVREVLYKE